MTCEDVTRRDFVLTGVSILAASAFGGGLSACANNQPLKIAVQPWCGYQFMHLAQQEGWLLKDKLELIATSYASESVTALEKGLVGGAALTLDEVLRLRDSGMRLSVVAVFDVSAGADVILAKPAITKLSELKGKRIGIESTSLGAIMLRKMLEMAGLNQDEVIVVPIDENHLLAWSQHNLDAIQAYEPTLTQLENKGLVRIFDSRSMPKLILDVLAVRTEVAESHPVTLRNLIEGHFRALNAWHSNPIDSAYHLSVLLGVKPEKVRSVYSGLDLPDALSNREYLIQPATELNQSAFDIAQIMTHDGILKHPLNLEQLFVADYLPSESE